jgi:HK97 family phage major capsid protein
MPVNEYTKLSPAARLELARLHDEAETILTRGRESGTLTRADGKRCDTIMAQMAAIRSAGSTTKEMLELRANDLRAAAGLPPADFSNPEAQRLEAAFRSYMNGGPEYRATDFLAGAQAISYSDGAEGGVLVATKFMNSVREGLAQLDPLLNENVATVIPEVDFRLPPLQLFGWDLSTIEATQVDENDQHAADTVPATTQKLLNKYAYRQSLGGSLEWEDDQRAFDSAMATMGRAFGIGFARGIGKACVTGNGVSEPAGILHGLASAFTTANAGKIVLADINDAFFAVNPIYRASKKCGWLLNDASYKLLSNSTDDAKRPLIDVVDGTEMLKGKPIHVTPSLPTSGAGSFCVFGDLSAYQVHVSQMYMRRNLQAPGYVEKGKALYTGIVLVDAVLHDPTGGSMPPVIAATLHA